MTTQSHALLQRLELLLKTARFVTLATASAEGRAWASTVNYVPHIDTRVRLLWYSMREARHSRNIEENAALSGSLFRTDLQETSPVGLDGLQFSGTCHAVDEFELEKWRGHFYQWNFPDESVRSQWMLPSTEFLGQGPRRFYSLTIEEWWLLDIDGWLKDKRDKRIDLPPPGRVAELAAHGEFAV
ncbi:MULTISPECIES: pyridoxamine 5'-phosphate oxidase family protein [Myxococcus]|uniref:pyridoxamine 5'-phosphate oxidase family protein n=1 Tax=Myxococcus TaxID=32 RepID=UPI0013D87248|nr:MULTISPECIES: pyridoxamine 5'-phosphate oxidase family protein [Myxococcus]NVJ22261.1 pyridoxamine 5'-phosphate oxidase family protein [Myxococcus sp. AM011]